MVATKKAVKPPAKKVPAAKKAAAPVEESKPRGRQRDVERDSKDLAVILKHVTIDGEFPNHRTKGLSAAAEAAGTDPIRARSIIDRHLAEKAGIQTATPKAVYDARLSGLGWGVIDAMFGISRSESHRLADEVGGEGWHSKFKLYGQGGAERIKPAAEPKPKSERAAGGSRKTAADFTPMFEGEETKEDIVSRLNGKTVTVRLRANGVESVGKVKVGKDTVKVGILKGQRVVKFTDGKGNARTVALESFLK